MAYRPYNLDCLWYVLYIWWLKTAVSEHQVCDIIKFAPNILYIIGNNWFYHCWHVTASSKYRPCTITDCSDFETFYICLSKKSFVFWPIFHSLKFILTLFASEAIRWGFLRMIAYITLFYILYVILCFWSDTNLIITYTDHSFFVADKAGIFSLGVVMMTSSNGHIFRVTGPLCGEFTGPGEFPTQRPLTRSFDVFFDLCLNKRLSKQTWGWWFETPPWSLWRHCNVVSYGYDSSILVFFVFLHEQFGAKFIFISKYHLWIAVSPDLAFSF